jgi:hypothetical protein
LPSPLFRCERLLPAGVHGVDPGHHFSFRSQFVLPGVIGNMLGESTKKPRPALTTSFARSWDGKFLLTLDPRLGRKSGIRAGWPTIATDDVVHRPSLGGMGCKTGDLVPAVGSPKIGTLNSILFALPSGFWYLARV